MYILKEANSLEQFDAFLALKSQKDAIKWSGFESAPNPDNFRQYYIEKILKNPATHVLFLCDTDIEGEPIVAYTQYDDVSNVEVDIRGTVIKRSYQGTDARDALNNLMMKHHQERGHRKYVTWISEKNIASWNNIIKMGYTQTGEYEIRNLPLLGGEHRFYKFVKNI